MRCSDPSPEVLAPDAFCSGAVGGRPALAPAREAHAGNGRQKMIRPVRRSPAVRAGQRSSLRNAHLRHSPRCDAGSEGFTLFRAQVLERQRMKGGNPISTTRSNFALDLDRSLWAHSGNTRFMRSLPSMRPLSRALRVSGDWPQSRARPRGVSSSRKLRDRVWLSRSPVSGFRASQTSMDRGNVSAGRPLRDVLGQGGRGTRHDSSRQDSFRRDSSHPSLRGGGL